MLTIKRTPDWNILAIENESEKYRVNNDVNLKCSSSPIRSENEAGFSNSDWVSKLYSLGIVKLFQNKHFRHKLNDSNRTDFDRTRVSHSPERPCEWWRSARGCDGVCVAGAAWELPEPLRAENVSRDPHGKLPLLPAGHKSSKLRHLDIQCSSTYSIVECGY